MRSWLMALSQEGEVVPEEQDRVRVHDALRPHLCLEEDGRHGRHVLVAEPDVGAEEAGLAGLHPGTPIAPWRRVHHQVRAKIFSATVIGRGAAARRRGHREGHLALQAGHVELEEAAVLDDLAGDLVLTVGELAQRDLLAAPGCGR